MPYGTDLATLKPAITITSGTCVPASGASPVLDVNNRATYTVTEVRRKEEFYSAHGIQVEVLDQKPLQPVSTILISSGHL